MRAQNTTRSAVTTATVVLAMLLIVAALAAVPATATTCGSLASLSLPDATISSATVVPAGGGLPAYCDVDGVATPTSDSVINFEVRLPLTGWNGKFNGDGNGGYGGSLSTPDAFSQMYLPRGYATAGTDMGHNATVTPGGSFALGHPEKIKDWGYRANHVTAVLAKIIIQAFYGTPPRLSYFTGCSDGGHEALMEAQRFPDDYDGIIGGDSANFWTHQSAAWVWEAQATLNDPASYIPITLLPMINQAAVAACEGVVPGVIDDPERCHFDPSTLPFLTAPQVEAVRKIYAELRNPRTGEQIYPGLEPGSEAAGGSLGLVGSWAILIEGPQTFLGGDFFEYFVFDNTNWDFHTLNFDSDIAFADAKEAAIINSTNPDLTPFRARGGKLIMYHGWADPLVAPRNSINYFDSVVRNIAEHHHRKGDVERGDALRETEKFIRLFMAPGMTHCEGGPGLNAFGNLGPPVPQDPEHDVLSALERWVEHGIAPDKIIATKYVNDDPTQGVFMTRPLCPYPQEAVYTGRGSTKDATNFVCREAEENNH